MINDNKNESNRHVENDGFILVKSKNKRKYSKKSFCHDLNDLKEETEETESKEEVLKKIDTCLKVLEEGSFYSTLLEQLTAGTEQVFGGKLENCDILCLGLGPFTSHLLSKTCRFQLALVISLKRKFNASVEVFDPVFTELEKRILTEEFHFKVSEENNQGKYRIIRPTLVYMPHCPHELVNNFLETNWKSDLLVNCYVLSNSFSSIVLGTSPKLLEKNLSYISKSQSVSVEFPISNSFKENSNAFNDLSLHLFPPKNLISL